MEFTTQIEKFLLLPPCPHKKYLLIELGLLYCLCLLNKDRCESQGKKNIHIIGSPEYLVGFSIRNLKNVGKDFTRTMEKALIISGHYSRGIKCRILRLDKNNQLHKYRMENKWLVAFLLKTVHEIY